MTTHDKDFSETLAAAYMNNVTAFITENNYVRTILYMLVFTLIAIQLTTANLLFAAKATIRIGKRVRQYKATKQALTYVVQLYSRLAGAARGLREHIRT